ncbi:MAG: HAD-IA family hydrolase [Pseudomonadota bacterium]
MIDAVIWDFGGVVTTSPFEAFRRFEIERGLPRDFIRQVNATNPDTNAWARLERSEIQPAAFDTAFQSEAEALGHSVSGREILALLSGDVRSRVVHAIEVCKRHGKVGCITNNAPVGQGAAMSADASRARAAEAAFALFDHVIESSKIGLRKPDPRIYALMCEALDVEPTRCVYIDDLGINLKPARAMGMTTIKALDEDQILQDLSDATGYEVL